MKIPVKPKTDVEALAEKVVEFLDSNAIVLEGDAKAAALYKLALKFLPPGF